MTDKLKQAMAASARKRREQRKAQVISFVVRKQAADAHSKTLREEEQDPLGSFRGKIHIAQA